MEITKKKQNAPTRLYRGEVKGSMKRLVLLMLVLLPFVAQQSKAIGIEARTGVSYCGITGLHAGAYLDFPQSKLFSIQTGLLLHTVGGHVFPEYRDFDLNIFVPVYASFHLPASEKTKIRLNAGAYVGTGNRVQLGPTAEVGVELKRFYIGAHCFQSFVDFTDTQLGVTFGYSFQL